MTRAYFTGLGLGLGLIVAIGAQNAFVLRQGLRREHVFWVCLVCAVSDALLIILGVTGFHRLSQSVTWLETFLRYSGAAFLAWYGWGSFKAAFKSSSGLTAAENQSVPLGPTLALCLALTWLNPHVYLDTVVMLGLLSTNYPGEEKYFAAGAMTASFTFFFLLGYGARLLRPIFAQPRAWCVFESSIGLLMWFLAFNLLTFDISTP